METSNKGIELITHFEGLKLKAYKCPAGIPTIGYGHTKDVKLSDEITEEQAIEFLKEDLKETEKFLEDALTYEFYNTLRRNITQNEFDALVSFIFNIGIGNFKNSSVRKELRKNNKATAANKMLLWNKARNPKTKELRPLPGLIRRRKAERHLFLYDEVKFYFEEDEG